MLSRRHEDSPVRSGWPVDKDAPSKSDVANLFANSSTSSYSSMSAFLDGWFLLANYALN